MTGRAFALVPFPSGTHPAIQVRGAIAFRNEHLAIRYSVEGNVDEVLLPPPATRPGRRDELWKATCFEFFLAVKGDPGYWEFNMSPSGDWNIYRMEAYRRVGFREEALLARLPFVFKREPERYSLEAGVDLSAILTPEREVELAVTAVLQMKDGSESYWALAHPGPVADFHLRDGFILSPAEQTRPSGQPVPDD
jgi:hypothetical protein